MGNKKIVVEARTEGHPVTDENVGGFTLPADPTGKWIDLHLFTDKAEIEKIANKKLRRKVLVIFEELEVKETP